MRPLLRSSSGARHNGYLGYLVAKLFGLSLVTSPYYSKHVARMLAQVTRRLARYVMERYSGLVSVAYFRTVTRPLDALCNLTRNPL